MGTHRGEFLATLLRKLAAVGSVRQAAVPKELPTNSALPSSPPRAHGLALIAAAG
ncbi:MAG: hypothetical protein GY788_30095 [bacterium]|nr:hypothetical protein [bacterium]